MQSSPLILVPTHPDFRACPALRSNCNGISIVHQRIQEWRMDTQPALLPGSGYLPGARMEPRAGGRPQLCPDRRRSGCPRRNLESLSALRHSSQCAQPAAGIPAGRAQCQRQERFRKVRVQRPVPAQRPWPAPLFLQAVRARCAHAGTSGGREARRAGWRAQRARAGRSRVHGAIRAAVTPNHSCEETAHFYQPAAHVLIEVHRLYVFATNMLRLSRLGLFACAASVLAAAGGAARTDAALSQAKAALARLPLRFEANQGQWDPAVRYAARANGYALLLTAGGPVVAFPGSGHVAINLVDSNRAAPIEPLDQLPAHTDY